MFDPGTYRQELKNMLNKAYDAYDAAKAKGDVEGMAKANALQEDIIYLLSGGVLTDLTELAKKLKALSDPLADETRSLKSWPFPAENFTHETQFKARFLDDEGDDGKPLVAATVVTGTKATAKAAASGWSEDYQALWETMEIRPEWREQADGMVKRIVAQQGKYAQAVEGTSIPWWFVAVVHALEANLDFSTHLHNGDPLSSRTVQVPKGRPAAGFPPFTWTASARDALVYEGLDKVTDWSLPNALYNWHRYNGVNNEYKRRKMPTPYLWSGSFHYLKGKYVADGVFDPEKVSKQLGAAILLKALVDLGAVTLSRKTQLVSNAAVAAQDFASLSVELGDAAFKHIARELAFPGHLKTGSTGNGVKRLQEWLSLQGVFTSIDSQFGPSTENALNKFALSHGRSASGVLDEELWAMLTAPLRKAVAPVTPAVSLEEMVIRVAQQHIAQRPREIGGNNCGPWVRVYMRGAEGEKQLWCAGFVSLIIEQACRELGVKMPFDRQVGVDALVADAVNDKRFIAQGAVSTPLLRQSKLRPGNLFVIRASDTDWTHVGIVLNLEADTFDTLEGNTGGSGGVDGDVARQHNRGYAARDFIRLI